MILHQNCIRSWVFLLTRALLSKALPAPFTYQRLCKWIFRFRHMPQNITIVAIMYYLVCYVNNVQILKKKAYMGLIFYCFSYFLSFYLVTTKFLDIYPKLSATHVTSHRNNKTAQKSFPTKHMWYFLMTSTTHPPRSKGPIRSGQRWLFCFVADSR